jgi:hypothetical protein
MPAQRLDRALKTLHGKNPPQCSMNAEPNFANDLTANAGEFARCSAAFTGSRRKFACALRRPRAPIAHWASRALRPV